MASKPSATDVPLDKTQVKEKSDVRGGVSAQMHHVLHQGIADGMDSQPESLDDLPNALTGFPRFEDPAMLGSGGMGIVHKVYDNVMRRQVAIKIIHAHLATEPEHRRRFLQEAHITGQLDHPNIVPVYDVWHVPEAAQIFFAMKLIEGENLANLLRKRRDEQLIGPPLEEYLQIFLKICDAIDFAHSRNVIHRDLKPSNIMVGTHGEVYVMDWGIAMRSDEAVEVVEDSPVQADMIGSDSNALTLSLMGTAAYMSPEQANNRIHDIDERTDVFGLGGIMYEILTAQPPHAGQSTETQLRKAKHGIVLPPEQAARHRRMPPGLCQIVMKALARDRSQRYASVRELKDAVRAFLRGGGWFHILCFEPGTVIVEEGDNAGSAYIIEEGYCEVYKTRGHQRTVLRRLGPGEVFGETAVLTNKPRTASVRAIDYVTAIAITGETLDYQIAEKGWISAFIKALAERFREIDRELSSLRNAD